MKDVAKKAGVSIATVSAVINNSAFVSETLKKRVIDAIEELGYRPNAHARSLKKSKTKLFGFMVRNITNPYYPEMVLGAEDAALEKGYNVFVCTTADQEEREKAFLESMLEHRVDGMLLAIVDDLQSNILQRLNAEKVPVVLVNRWPEGYKGSAVVADNFEAGLLATYHLISLGYKEIAFIGASPRLITSRLREKGYRQAMEEAGLPIPEKLVHYCEYSEDKAYLVYRELIKAKMVPRAIFAANDLMAFGAARALLEAGYRIPDDVAIVGCDNIDFSSKFLIPLTTVHIPKYEMGKLAAELLLEILQSPDNPPNEFIKLSPQLIIRNSCGSTHKHHGILPDSEKSCGNMSRP